jgi:dephospho-CoA kinase
MVFLEPITGWAYHVELDCASSGDLISYKRVKWMIVGLTGGIGSGKTTVADFFRELGAHVIDWDELAREAVQPHLPAWEGIVDHFGGHVLNDDLTIDRAKVSDIVFNDEKQLAFLNQIVHPEVFKEDTRLTDEITKCGPNALIVKEIPLLFEASLTSSVDRIIVVYAGEKTRLRRLEEKGVSREEVLQRMRAQLPLEDKAKSADFVIDNDGSIEETRRHTERVYSLLTKDG